MMQSELDFLSNTRNFFMNAEGVVENTYSSLSIEECREFFKKIEAVVKRSQVESAYDVDGFLETVKGFFEKVRSAIDQIARPETLCLGDCRDFFIGAERTLNAIQTQVPIEKFREFCAEAYPSLMREYRRWIRFIEENNTDGIQKINFLKVFGISAREEPHSKFLVWLMKENESHGIGSAFLDGFLDLLARRYNNVESLSSEAATVIPEASGDRGTPDIKILGADFLCIVENKIRSAEGKDQTKRYAEDAMEEIKKIKVSEDRLFLIYLTPTGRAPLDSRFKSMDYNELITLLRDIIQREQNINDPTRFLIEQFILNLEMEILNVFNLEKLINACLMQYSKQGDKYLWRNQEHVYRIYEELVERRGNNG
jgi:hypothetical protein